MDNNEIVLISDVHFGVHANDIEWKDNIVNYFDNFFIPLLKKEIDKGNKPLVFVLGDFFENRTRLNIDIIDVATKTVEKIASICPFYMLVGNHDCFKKVETDINSINIFKNIPNVRIFESNECVNIGGVSVDVMPWFGDDSECFRNANRFIKSSDANLIFMHSDINGFSMDNGFPITDGLDPKNYKGGRIYSGHIHKRQVGKKVTYIGSPYHTSKSDIDNVKGIYILHCSESGYTEEFVENDYSPKFVKVQVEDLYNGEDKEILNNNYVNIVGKSNDNNIKLREFLHNYNIRSYDYTNRQVEQSADVLEHVEIGRYRDKSGIVSMLEEAIDVLDGISDEDKEYMKKINKQNFENEL